MICLHACAIIAIDDDTFSALINVVIESKECSHSVNQHPMIRRHLGELMKISVITKEKTMGVQKYRKQKLHKYYFTRLASNRFAVLLYHFKAYI